MTEHEFTLQDRLAKIKSVIGQYGEVETIEPEFEGQITFDDLLEDN